MSHHELTLAFKRWLYRKRGEPYRLNNQVLRYLPGTRPIRLRYVRSRNGVARYDALQTRLLRANVAEGDTAVDIGAHCGQYSILMAALCGQQGSVVAFEPDPYARQTLRRNICLNPGIKAPVVEDCALSDAPGEGVLYCDHGNSQSSLARTGSEFADGDRSEKIPVKLVSLDAYLVEKGLPDPRWVKIDAEGAEIRILKGARRVLSSSATILCELHPYAWPDFGSTLSELKALAAASGRRLRYLDEESELGASAGYGALILERRC